MRKPAFSLGENKSADQLLRILLNRLNNPFVIIILNFKPVAFFFGCTVSSSSKGNNHSPESHYKSIVTFKMLRAAISKVSEI